MATSSMDKGLYAAPLGLEEEMGMAPPLEIEIEDRDSVAQFVLISCTLQS